MPSSKWNRILALFAIFMSAGTTFGEAVCDQAVTLFQQRRWSDASEAFANCEKVSPGKTDALLYRGKSLANQFKFAAAAESLESYLSAHAQSGDALYLLGYVRFRQDQPRESLAIFTQAAKLNPPGADDLKIAALDYVLLEDYTSAARYLEQSLQLNPENVEARYHLGRVRYQQNQFDAAIAAFQEVLRQKPGDVKAEDNLGLCFEAQNEITLATAAYQRAIEFDSASAVHSEQPYLNFGKLLTTLNRAGESVPLLAKAVDIAPQSATAHYELGRALFTLGQLDPARLQLEHALRLDPGNSSFHYLLGRIYKRAGKGDQATKQFKLTEDLIRERNAKSGGMATGR